MYEVQASQSVVSILNYSPKESSLQASEYKQQLPGQGNEQSTEMFAIVMFAGMQIVMGTVPEKLFP